MPPGMLVFESMSQSREMYGQERLQALVSRYAHLEVEQIVANIMRDIQAFAPVQSDDLTLVVIQRRA